MKNVSRIGDHISVEEAYDMIFSGNPHTSYTQARVFGKSQLYKILKNKQCHGVRVYIAKDPDPKQADLIDLIIVGVDSQGNDLTDLQAGSRQMLSRQSIETDANILNRGLPCPPKCIENA